VEIRRTLEVKNPQGLHARPCHAVVAATLEYDCDVRVSCGGRAVNGKSILELMSLNAPCGTRLEFRLLGQQAEELMERLQDLFDTGFGESPR
jgi:phosphocarrier protein